MAPSSIVFWLVDRSDAVERVRAKLTPLVGSLSLFKDEDECLAQLARADAPRVRLVVSESNGEQFIRRIPSREKLHSIYVLCSNGASQRHWQSVCRPVRCVLTDLASLCERIRTADEERDNDLAFDVVGPSTTAEGPDKNRQEAAFMCGQLLRDVLTQMEYSAEDKKSMFEFLRAKGGDTASNIQKINELEKDYCADHAIQYYSIHVFLYKTLNDALRDCNVEEMVKLGVFIKDLYKQLAQEHRKAAKPSEKKLYRGVVIPRSIFEQKINGKEGGLMSVKEFISTSFNIAVAEIFASKAADDKVRIIFHIDLSSSCSTNTVYVDIREYSHFPEEVEILFSMGSVFRIGGIRRELDGVYHIDLSLTSDHDEQLTALTRYYQELLSTKNWGSLCALLMMMGDYQTFVQVCQVALKRTTDAEVQKTLLSMWSAMCIAEGDMSQAEEKLNKAFMSERESNSRSASDALKMILQAEMFFTQGHFDEARTLLFQAEEIFRSHPLFASRPEFRSICPMLRARLSSSQGCFTDALQILERSTKEDGTPIPDLHPLNANLGVLLGCLSGNKDSTQSSEYLKNAETIIERTTLRQNPLVSQYRYAWSSIKARPPPPDDETPPGTGMAENFRILMLQATSFYAQKRLSDALSTVDKAISLMEKHSSTPTMPMISAFAQRARWLKEQGNRAEALKSLQTAEGMLPASMISGNLSMGLVFGPMAEIYIEQDNDAEALRVLERCHHRMSQSTDRDLSDIDKCQLKIVSLMFAKHGSRCVARSEHHKAVRLFRSNLKVCLMFFADDLAQLSQAYLYLGNELVCGQNFAEALPYLEKARRSSQNGVHFELSDRIHLWRLFGDTYYKVNRLDEALAASLECLELQQRADPSAHEDICRIHQFIGGILCDQGHFAEAIFHCQRALDIHATHFPTQQAKGKKCREMLEEVYRIQQKKKKKSSDATTAESYRRSAHVHMQNERFAEALHDFRRLLEIQNATLQPDDRAFDDTHFGIGIALFTSETLVEARPHLEHALRGYRKYLPETDQKIQDILAVLAVDERFTQTRWANDQKQRALSLAQQGKYREALSMLEECLSIERALLPADDLQLASTLQAISLQHFLLEQFAAARDHLESALPIFLQHLPGTVQITIEGYLLLAQIHQASAQYLCAISAAEQALEFQLNILAPDDVKVAETCRLLAMAHCAAGNGRDAVEYTCSWHNIHESTLPPDDPRVLHSANALQKIMGMLETKTDKRRSTTD